MDPLAYRLLDVVRHPDSHTPGCEGRPSFEDPDTKERTTCKKCKSLEQRYAGSNALRTGEIVADLEFIRDELADSLIYELNRAKDLAHDTHGQRGAGGGRSGTDTSDPTGSIATSPVHEAIRLLIRTSRQQVRGGRDLLESARKDLIRATARADHSSPKEVSQTHPYTNAHRDLENMHAQRRREGLCITCGEHPAAVDDRCKACDKYKKRTGIERPESLIKSATEATG